MDALIGYTGFVGSTLLKQNAFQCQYRSTNIGEIKGHSFDMIVCAGAPAQKWIANREPQVDARKIEALIECLKTVQCRMFVLISTVDVFKNPVGVNELSPVDEDGLHPYGAHRRLLEKFVATNFDNHLILRLPGLVGPGLRKNVIFDLLNDNNLHAIDSRGTYQFYPMVNLWYDIQTAMDAGLNLVHLTSQPVSVADIAAKGFGRPFNQAVSNTVASYDMQTIHARTFGGEGLYQYTMRETIQAIRAFAQSEPLTDIAAKGAGA